MMAKLRRYTLPILLGIAVLISVVLSVSLLTNPARFSGRVHEKKADRKSTRLNSSHVKRSRMPSSA